MPVRILLILVAIAVIILGVKRLFAPGKPVGGSGKNTARMVQCAHCGMYVPEPEACERQGLYYCSPAHLEADKS
jgi:uncharacterized protein